MKKKPLCRKPKRVLRLPDLDHAKTAVLNTLGSPDSQRSYRFAIEDFVGWYWLCQSGQNLGKPSWVAHL
jgi:hypothetical protein